MYWVLNIKNNKAIIFGSIPVMEKELGYRKRKLSVHFSEKKEISFKDENYRIERVGIKKTVRQKI